MTKNNARTILLLAAILCASCTTVPFTNVPDELHESGLLVAEVVGDWGTWAGSEGSLNPVIDGVEYKGGNRDEGFLVVPLSPGEHTLDRLRSASVWMNVNRKFKIESGRVTNIGRMFLRVPPGSKNTDGSSMFRYFLHYLDNTASVNEYLQAKHPRLYASLKERPVKLSPGKYLSSADFKKLRGELARDRVVAYPELFRDRSIGYVAAGAGLLAKLERDASGMITNVRALDVQDFPDLSYCSIAETRAACLISEQEYLYVQGDVVRKRKVPKTIAANSLLVFGSKGMVLVDNYAMVYTSADMGNTWRRYTGVARKEPLSWNVGLVTGRRGHSFGLQPGRKGYYVFASLPSSETFVLYADYETNTYAPLPPPKGLAFVQRVHETDYGLFLDPAGSGLFGSALYVYRWDTKTWETQSMPLNCSSFAFPDRSGKTIEARCQGGYSRPYRSDDYGKTWTEAARTSSVAR